MKKAFFSFLLSSESTFGKAKGTHKREQYKMKKAFFAILLSSESSFGLSQRYAFHFNLTRLSVIFFQFCICVIYKL